MGAGSETTPATGTRSAPAWLEAIPVSAGVAVACIGVVGLVAAMTERFATLPVLAVALPLAALLLIPVLGPLVRGASPARDRPFDGDGDDEDPDHQGAPRRAVALAAAAALVLALAYSVFAGAQPSQHVLIGRDPGSYLTTARWIEREGSLRQEPRWTGFDPAGDSITYVGAAQYDAGDGLVEFQFNHLTSVVLATAEGVAGGRATFRVSALAVALGLLAVYAVTVRVTGRPWLSLAAPGVLAAAMPVLYVARDTFSEPVSLLLLWSTVLVLLEVHRRPSAPLAATGGVLLGALVASRIDALLFLALCPPFAALSIATGSGGTAGRRARAWAVVGAAAVLPAVVGMVDLFAFSGGYASGEGDSFRTLLLAVVASAVLSAIALVLWSRWPAVRRVATSVRRPVAWVAAVGAVAAFLAGWLLRPHLGEVTWEHSFSLVEAIQVRDGLAVAPDRSYAEQSIVWASWYLGSAALVLSALGLGLAVGRTVLGRARPATMVVAAIFLTAGAASWWRPSIAPDQVWAMRRFVPTVLPVMAILGVLAVAAVSTALARWWPSDRAGHRLARPLVAILGTALLVVPPARVTWPLREQRFTRGYAPLMDWTCRELPDRSAVIIVGSLGRALAPGLRAWCGVPVGIGEPSLTPEQVAAVGAASQAKGRSVVLVAGTAAELEPFRAVVAPPATSPALVSDRVPQHVLDRAPTEFQGPTTLGLVVAPVA